MGRESRCRHPSRRLLRKLLRMRTVFVARHLMARNGALPLLTISKKLRPHPEERGTRVSKDGPRVPLPPSFETLASQAPQDEDFTYARLRQAHRKTSGAGRSWIPPARTSCPFRTDRTRLSLSTRPPRSRGPRRG